MNDAVIGLDAVTMVVSGKCPKQIEQRIEKRNKQGRLYLEVDKTKQNETYNVTIVLPSIIRPSNLKGFSLLDSVKLEYVIDVVKHDLQEILGTNNLEQLIVKKLEINANKSVPSRVNADAITELMARALLKPDAQQIEHCHGVNIHEARTIKTKIIDGFKTARDSTGRYQCKFYRKDRQLELENKINPTIRMELVYNAKGVSQALGKKGKGISVLTDILQQSAMQKLIQRYVMDVRASIMPAIRLYLEDATNLVLNDLKAGNGAYKTFLKRYDILKYDFRIFRTAMFKFYKLVGNTKQRIAEDYGITRGKTGRKREAYEEIWRTWQEMKSGIPEMECYERFARRCDLIPYMKMGALLSQNLKKGAKGISEMLRMEAVQALEDRKSRARQLGEEAGTRLLIPMLLMLIIVITIVVVPAFLSIQV